MGTVVILGGGIAGVATAWALARRGRTVRLLESERQLGTQSTGRNAAIFRVSVADPVNVALAVRSREIGQQLVQGGVVRTCGGYHPCRPDEECARILEAGRAVGVRMARAGEAPTWLGARERPALVSPQDGVLDVHALMQALAADARAHGAVLQLGARAELVRSAGRVDGVAVGGEFIAAEQVVDATGAWSASLPHAPCDAVRPHRRHLFVLDSPAAAAVTGVVWDLADGMYVRPESGGVLVSPCDETAMPATTEVPRDADLPAHLFERLVTWAPALANATLRTWWAGLRPLTADHRFVVGPDPSVPGLFRVGGFGGHGMTAGPAAGEVAAALLCGADHPWASSLAPGNARSPSAH